jgi:hypothetical protein
MKKVFLLMLLMGGTVLTTYAQRGYDRGYRDHGRGHGHDRWERDRCEPPRREYRRGWDDDCYRPRRRVVYVQPAYYPVVPVPVPAPVRYYPARPRAVFHAGVTIVN